MSHALDGLLRHNKAKKSKRRHSLTGTGIGAVPVAAVGATAAPLPRALEALSLNDRVTHLPEQVIQHAPIVEKEILNEANLQLRHEHHIQPIIHETERRVQPIIKTNVTTERPVVVKDTAVMEAPLVERAALPVGLGAVERVAPEGVVHVPKVERQVVVERPVEVRLERHIQPIIHEREHQIQPIIKTNVTTEHTVMEQDKHILHAPIVERGAAPLGLEGVARVLPEAGIVEHLPKVVRDVEVERRVQVNHEHHVKTVFVERVRHLRPVVHYEVVGTEEHVVGEKEDVVVLPPTMEAPVLARATAATTATTATSAISSTATTTSTRSRITKPLPPIPVRANRTTATSTTTGSTLAPTSTTDARGRSRAGLGQKLKGAVKQLQGSLTHNPAMKEEGKLISEGVDPQRAHTMASRTSTGGAPL